MNIVVCGLGRIGLPLALISASAGHTVYGYDVDAAKVSTLNAGKCYMQEPGCQLLLSTVKTFRAYSDSNDIPEYDLVVVTVPLTLSSSGAPDFTALDEVIYAFSGLIIVETTLPPGTVANRWPDKQIAYSPERVSAGTILANFALYPKLITGNATENIRSAMKFYTSLGLEVWPCKQPEVLELAKVYEGIYRYVNIALATQLSHIAGKYGVEYKEVREFTNSQPFCHLHSPTYHIGGHCVPVYPKFLDPDRTTNIIKLAEIIQDDVFLRVMHKFTKHIPTGGNVLIIGASFRPNVDVMVNSGAKEAAKWLRSHGVSAVYIYDPMFTQKQLFDIGIPINEVISADGIIVNAYHDEFEFLDWESITCKVVLDARNALDKENIERTGKVYIGV